jgi:hypothetical protein
MRAIVPDRTTDILMGFLLRESPFLGFIAVPIGKLPEGAFDIDAFAAGVASGPHSLKADEGTER